MLRCFLTKPAATGRTWVTTRTFTTRPQKLNPITGKMEWNGTSILDVNDPANLKLVAEPVNGRLNRFEHRLAWVAYFNAGVRLVDLSDPIILGKSATMCRKRTRRRTRWRRGRGSRFR
jgi:hypothetical protein